MLVDEIYEFIPHPGWSRPAGMIVAQNRNREVVDVNLGITLAWCFGLPTRAVQLKRALTRLKKVRVCTI